MESNIRVVEKKGTKEGKNLVVLIGIHGNEVCGIKAADLLLPRLKIDSGKVTIIYANLEAIKQNKRYVEKNLNRCFFKKQPEEIRDSLEGNTAKEISPYLEEADAMLDIHASFTMDSIPFVICDKKWIKMANIFDSEIVTYNWDPFEPGSTDYFMNLMKKPGFCFECGYLGEEMSTERAKKAITSFLSFFGAIEKEVPKKESQSILKIISLYKNTKAPFLKSRYFPDFEVLKKKEIIGKEGNKKVYGYPGDILLFVRDSQKLNGECFLKARVISSKQDRNKPHSLKQKL